LQAEIRDLRKRRGQRGAFSSRSGDPQSEGVDSGNANGCWGGGGMILEKADTASPYGQDDGILTERVRSAAEEMRVSYVPNASDPDDRRTMQRHNTTEAV